MIWTEERFWSKVAYTETCWIWRGALRKGYGYTTRGGRRIGAHRVAYELRHGTIDAGLEVDHLCRVPACVNPDHLEPVTHAINMARSTWATRPRCPRGHAYDGTRTSQGSRRCKPCEAAAARRWRQRARAGSLSGGFTDGV